MKSFVALLVGLFLNTVLLMHTSAVVAESFRPPTAPLLGGSHIDLSGSPVALILTRKFMCTGVLVGTHEVLTAGHCISAEANEYLVVVGDEKHTVTTVVQNSAFNQDAPATLAIIKHDLGMLLLSSPVQSVTPVPVLLDLPIKKGDRLSVTARGANELSEDAQQLGTGRSGPFLVDDSNGSVFISTRLPLNSSTCPGDSGAPAFRTIQGAIFVAGIVSAGTNSVNGNGVCVSSSRGVSAFVDLQSEFSKVFLSQFAGVQSASGRYLFVNDRLLALSQRVTPRSVITRSSALLRELKSLTEFASTDQLRVIATLIKALRSVRISSSARSRSDAVRVFRIASAQIRVFSN